MTRKNAKQPESPPRRLYDLGDGAAVEILRRPDGHLVLVLTLPPGAEVLRITRATGGGRGRMSAWTYYHRKKWGRCVTCAGKPAPGLTRCGDCALAVRDRNNVRYYTLRRAGKCVDCKGPSPDATRCGGCAARRRREKKLRRMAGAS